MAIRAIKYDNFKPTFGSRTKEPFMKVDIRGHFELNSTAIQNIGFQPKGLQYINFHFDDETNTFYVSVGTEGIGFRTHLGNVAFANNPFKDHLVEKLKLPLGKVLSDGTIKRNIRLSIEEKPSELSGFKVLHKILWDVE